MQQTFASPQSNEAAIAKVSGMPWPSQLHDVHLRPAKERAGGQLYVSCRVLNDNAGATKIRIK